MNSKSPNSITGNLAEFRFLVRTFCKYFLFAARSMSATRGDWWHSFEYKFPLIALGTLLSALLWAQPAWALTEPTITPGTGTFADAQTVQITAPQGTIYYTTNGTVPDNTSNEYVGQFTVSSPTEIKAVAYDSGMDVYSSVSTTYLDIDPEYSVLLDPSLILRLRAGFGVVEDAGDPPPVLSVADLSGNGNDATAGSGSEPLLLRIPCLGAELNFNGSTQMLSLPSGFDDFTEGATIFAVVRPLSSSDAPIMDLGQGMSGNNVVLLSGADVDPAQLGVFSGASPTYADSAAPLIRSMVQVLEAVLTPDIPNGSGTVLVTGSPGTTNDSMNNIASVVRADNFIGQSSTGAGAKFGGGITELLIYNSSLSGDARSDIRQSLIRRYRITNETPIAPLFSVPSGSLSGPTQVAISPARNCGITRFTTDGTTPTSLSPIYQGPIRINYSQTLKAINVENGMTSPVSTATYTLDSSQWPAPAPGDTTAPTINLQLPVPSF